MLHSQCCCGGMWSSYILLEPPFWVERSILFLFRATTNFFITPRQFDLIHVCDVACFVLEEERPAHGAPDWYAWAMKTPFPHKSWSFATPANGGLSADGTVQKWKCDSSLNQTWSKKSSTVSSLLRNQSNSAGLLLTSSGGNVCLIGMWYWTGFRSALKLLCSVPIPVTSACTMTAFLHCYREVASYFGVLWNCASPQNAWPY